jgi:hypothetical protein
MPQVCLGVDFVNRQLIWLDLCSGLGGASQPALDRGWKVIRVDIDPRFKPVIVADVRALPFSADRCRCGHNEVWHWFDTPLNKSALAPPERQFCTKCRCHKYRLKPFHVDVLWASPPCTEFSRRALPWFRGKFGPPSLELIKACSSIVKSLQPTWYVIENVRSAREWLTPLLGPVRYYSTGHVLWGRLPGLLPNIAPHKGNWGSLNGSGGVRPQIRPWMMVSEAERKRRHGIHGEFVKGDPAIAGKIPYEIGEAICRAVEQREGVMQFGAAR